MSGSPVRDWSWARSCSASTFDGSRGAHALQVALHYFHLGAQVRLLGGDAAEAVLDALQLGACGVAQRGVAGFRGVFDALLPGLERRLHALALPRGKAQRGDVAVYVLAGRRRIEAGEVGFVFHVHIVGGHGTFGYRGAEVSEIDG